MGSVGSDCEQCVESSHFLWPHCQGGPNSLCLPQYRNSIVENGNDDRCNECVDFHFSPPECNSSRCAFPFDGEHCQSCRNSNWGPGNGNCSQLHSPYVNHTETQSIHSRLNQSTMNTATISEAIVPSFDPSKTNIFLTARSVSKLNTSTVIFTLNTSLSSNTFASDEDALGWSHVYKVGWRYFRPLSSERFDHRIRINPFRQCSALVWPLSLI